MPMTIQPTGKPVADPAEMVRVQVHRRAADGSTTPHPDYAFFGELEWPAWHVPALAELLLKASPDPGTLLRMNGHPYYKDSGARPKPAALRQAGDEALTLAERLRDARWHGRVPTCRDMLHEHHKSSPEELRSTGTLSWSTRSLLTMLVEANDALVWQCTTEEEVRQARERCEKLVNWIGAATHYGSIPPSREVELMTQGYTVAEFLVHCGIGWILRLADDYEKVHGPNAESFAAVAKKARLSAALAQRVIEQGVRYTLERRK